MLRNIIGSPNVTEVYEVTADIKRGSIVTKNLSTGKAVAADGVGVDVYIITADNQPTGHLSDVEVSAYDDSLDVIKAGARAVLNKYPVGAQFATDQVVATGFAAGDYAIAGTTTNVGKLIKAISSKVSTLKYLGTYDDAGHTLYKFEVVNQVTVA